MPGGEDIKPGDFPIRVVTIPGHAPGAVGRYFQMVQERTQAQKQRIAENPNPQGKQ